MKKFEQVSIVDYQMSVLSRKAGPGVPGLMCRERLELECLYREAS